MSLTKRLGLIAGAALSMSGVAMAQSSMDQSRAVTNELLSDAASRASLLAAAGGQTFTPKVGGYEQFRYVINRRDDNGLDANDNDLTLGFQNARTRLNVSGNIFNEDWAYFIQFGFGDSTDFFGSDGPGGSSSSGAFLEDAYGTYKIGNGWDVMWGQFKLPWLREELIGDTSQLAIERSVTNSVFSQGRSQGIQLGYSSDSFRFMGAFSDGVQTANTDFTSGSEADFGITARGDFKWAGDWKQFNDFTSWQNSQFAGMAGGAFHYQSGGDTVNTADVDIWAITGDVMIKGNGWNAFAELVYQNTDPSAGNETADWGFVLQGGIFVAPQWELFGRYDLISPDSDRTTDDNFSTLTFGVNHYITPESQAAKLTAQLEYFLDTQNKSIASPNTLTGLLGSAEDGQFAISAQLQLVF